MKTFIPKASDIQNKWYVVDVSGKTFGRQIVQIARIISGKHKPMYTPHLDVGDHVIVVNAQNIKISGNKGTELFYYHYTGYPGGLRKRSFDNMLKNAPDRLFRIAVWKMIPKNKLARKMITKLHVYAGADHPHIAQKPEPLSLD